ncbi:FAD-dependent monooxygenase [Verrucosispora sp. WMMC514]|uniref:FAD-dependent monooxygenase n=1 Tax=Verrucosispora sp. WMMC514 TaxID=3015156 RepID=UPI00248C6EA9|nr:FAD-dependent monooxygenase [Verrucosispora sp. WMMC514]WBB89985.1 FAD-dependent monooxygenase [Verrucosispora sp. WMMC514]
MTAVPVVIVGAGPTGLTAATLLAQYGVECLILERWDSTYPQPRAVALDDEVHRILARLGLGDEFAAISRPHLGLRLLDRDMRVLAEFRRDHRSSFRERVRRTVPTRARRGGSGVPGRPGW